VEHRWCTMRYLFKMPKLYHSTYTMVSMELKMNMTMVCFIPPMANNCLQLGSPFYEKHYLVKKLNWKTFNPPKGIKSAFFMYDTIRLWLATIILVYLTNTFFLTVCSFRNSKREKSYGYLSKGDHIGGTSTVQDSVLIQNAETVPYVLYIGLYGNENGLDHVTLHSSNGI